MLNGKKRKLMEVKKSTPDVYRCCVKVTAVIKFICHQQKSIQQQSFIEYVHIMYSFINTTP